MTLPVPVYIYMPMYFAYTVRAAAMSSVPEMIVRPSGKTVIS